MKKTLINLLAILLCKISFAQQSAKAIFFELAGPGLASVNYDMRFTKSEKGIGGRIGIGGFSFGTSSDNMSAIFIPIAVNYLLGKDERNYFEIGGGVTPVFTKNTFDSEGETFRNTFGHLTFGYRLQPKTEGFTFRAHMTPVFGKCFFMPYYFIPIRH